MVPLALMSFRKLVAVTPPRWVLTLWKSGLATTRLPSTSPARKPNGTSPCGSPSPLMFSVCSTTFCTSATPERLALISLPLKGIGRTRGLGRVCFLDHDDQRLVSRHVHREGVGGVEGRAAAGIAEIVRADCTCIPRGRRNVGVEVGHGKNGATRSRVRRGERDRSASRSRSVREAQDIVAPISTSEDARAGFGRSATAHGAIPAHAAFLDGIGRIQAAIHNGGRLLARYDRKVQHRRAVCE